MIRINLIANITGILSLLSSFAIICPTFIHLFQNNVSHKKLFSKISYVSLLITICFGLIHGLLATQLANIDYFNIHTYWIYAGGLLVFNLFVLIAIAFPELKHNLKKFDYLNYAVLLLLIFHVGQKIMY